ncbi:hypothetical protein LWI28_016985 [Acer negundo]|uniref:Uncharacterized protein n=1 Tax=Acer negundo TaxID=4023 RepID=A0AAD5J6Q4_ACENE|nr:hypothetical protein LWI28_016985 [Acer negundo]
MEKMWKTKGGVYVALLVMLVMILFINANPSRATSLVPKMSNNSAGSGCSSIHDCLITDHQSLEFLLGSEADTKPPLDIAKSLNSSTPIADCGRGKVHITLFCNLGVLRATSLVMKMSSNNSDGSGCSSIHDCLIADHQSLEFLLGSEANTKQTFDIKKSLNGGKPIVDCGRGKKYKQCVPNPHEAK